MSSWHIATAAEAIVAAQFARFGYDISVQYGANQPEYDLIAARGGSLLKLSVKGSQDGGWGLTQSFMSKDVRADYHGAADRWLARHTARTAICLVQFRGVPDTELPRMYLAWPYEVAAQLREASAGRGDTILYEDHIRGPRAKAAGIHDRIPDHWRLTRERADALVLAEAYL